MATGSAFFNPALVADELVDARAQCRAMLNGVAGTFQEGSALTIDDLAFFGFLERAQAFHLGIIKCVESGNPLAAVTLLRSYAENAAVVFWIKKRPGEIAKMRPGATEGFPIGRVIAEAERNLPGFKEIYSIWSDFAHPSGSGAFHTMNVTEKGEFHWQSHPNFRNVDDARQILKWLDSICELTSNIIAETAKARSSASTR